MDDVISGKISVEVDSSALGKVCYTFAYSSSGDMTIVRLENSDTKFPSNCDRFEDSRFRLQHVIFRFGGAALKSFHDSTVDEITDRLELLICKHVYQELEEIPGEIKGVIVDRSHGLRNWANYLRLK